jgi:hypothetical protein
MQTYFERTDVTTGKSWILEHGFSCLCLGKSYFLSLVRTINYLKNIFVVFFIFKKKNYEQHCV